MSIIHCDGCDKRIDTDEDVDCYDSEGQAYCERCRDEHEADGIILAAEWEREVERPLRERKDIIEAGRGHLLGEHND